MSDAKCLQVRVHQFGQDSCATAHTAADAGHDACQGQDSCGFQGARATKSGTRSIEFVDIEIDSGAEVSCLPANIGADTYPLHETRLSMCECHHGAAGGGKLYELGAGILGLEAGDVRGNMVNLLVRF